MTNSRPILHPVPGRPVPLPGSPPCGFPILWLLLAGLAPFALVGLAPAVAAADEGILTVEPVRVQQVTATPSPPVPFSIPEEADPLPGVPADQVAPPVGMPQKLAGEDDESSTWNRSVRELITYDLRTRTRSSQVVNQASLPGIRVSQAGEGDPAALEPHEGLPPEGWSKDFSSLVWVPDPNTGVYPMHVKLKMRWVNVNGDEVTGSCSGTLIDPKHVVTAGHCVYKHEDSAGNEVEDFPQSLTAYTGYSQGSAGPNGSSNGVTFQTVVDWIVYRDYDYDFAIVELDRPVGSLVGWRAVGTHSDCDYFESPGWTRLSYPGEELGGEMMYQQSGDYDDCDTNAFGWYGNNLQFDRHTYKGMSGSGGVKNNTVWSVVSHGDGLTGLSNDTRIDPGFFDDIVEFVDFHSPDEFDFYALGTDVYGSGGVVGSPIQDLSFLVHNYSKQEGDAFISYTVYLSANDNITEGDHYVTSGSFTHDFSRNGSVRVNVPNAIVPPVVTGDYFLGVILTQEDAYVGNNETGIQDVAPFSVLCETQGIPLLVTPEDMHPCVPTDLTFDWASIPGIGVDYQLAIRTIPGLYDSNAYIDAPNDQHTVFGLLPGQKYGWKVRATTECGAYSDWSQEFEFTTAGVLSQVTGHHPEDGSFCAQTTTTLTWNAVPGASLYRVRFAADGEPGDELYTTNPSYIVPNLDPDTLYHWNVTPADGCANYGADGEFVSFRTVTAVAPDAPNLLSPVGGEFTPSLTMLEQTRERWANQYEWELQTLAGTPVDAGTELTHYEWVVGPLAAGNYRWRARYEQCMPAGGVWSPWSEWATFVVDGQPPVFVQGPYSPTHEVTVWSGADDVVVNWPWALDDHDVATYWWTWDQSPDTVPDGTHAGLQNTTNQILTSGQDHWFHLVAVDVAGNVSEPEHLGPFYIDLDGPTIAGIITDPINGEWSQVAEVMNASWDAAVDALSGVAGYSLVWSTNKVAKPDAIVDQTETTLVVDPLPEGIRYLRVGAVDAVGNLGPLVGAQILLDKTAPDVTIWTPNGGETISSGYEYEVGFAAVDEVVHFSFLVLEYDYTTNGGQTWYPAEMRIDQQTYEWITPWAPPGAEVLFRVTATDLAGNVGEDVSDAPFTIDAPTSTPDLAGVTGVELGRNVPNPLNPRTTIRFAVPQSTRVKLEIYDVQGRLVRRLLDEVRPGPAWHEVSWEGTDDARRSVASGVYIARLEAAGTVATRRMTLLK